MSEKYNEFENEMNLEQANMQPETTEPIQAQESSSQPEQPAVYGKHDFSAFETPQAQPQEPIYTNPYLNYDQPKTAYTERPSDSAAAPPDMSYDDGFYHKSFSREHSGDNVNYTTPSYPYSTPQQPAPPAYTEPRKKEKRGLGRGGVALLLVVCLILSGAAGFGGSMLEYCYHRSFKHSCSTCSHISY